MRLVEFLGGGAYRPR